MSSNQCFTALENCEVIRPDNFNVSNAKSEQPILDLSKIRKKPVSEGFIFPKSIELQLSEALAEIIALKKENEELKNTIAANQIENEELNNIIDARGY